MVSQELAVPGTSSHKEVIMPTTREFSIRMQDEPGTLEEICRALANRKVNIMAFQSFPFEGRSLVRFVVDNPTTAKTILESQKFPYTETEVAQVKFPNQPGELARAASQLGEADINIDYSYSGLDATTNAPLLIFGVANADRAAKILEKASAKAVGA
jgi:hypothetical protein